MEKFSKILVFTVLVALCACNKTPEPIVPPIVDNYSLIAPPTGLTKNAALSTSYPKTAAMFEMTTPFRAYACVFDLSDTTLALRTGLNTARQTPTDWQSSISSDGTKVLMLVNGGYFDLTNGSSYSLAIDNSKIASFNVKALSRTYNGTATNYYPTRGAFGLTKNTPSVGWVYNTSGTDNYMYPSPSPNALNTAPQAVPTASFPAGGALWSPSVAIGGSPVLMYKNSINISDAAELIDINNTTGRSRTAIGFTADKRVVVLTIEKSTTRSTNGANLVETAQLMKDWGCTDALNLDGGGSTCMLAWGNQSTNTPEAGAQRAVTSVVYLTKK